MGTLTLPTKTKHQKRLKPSPNPSQREGKLTPGNSICAVRLVQSCRISAQIGFPIVNDKLKHVEHPASAAPSLLFISLWVAPFHLLIVSAFFHLSAELVVLRSTPLLFYVVPSGMRFAVFEFVRLDAIRISICHSIPPLWFMVTQLSALPAALSAAGLTTTFGCTATTGTTAATLLVTPAPCVRLATCATSTAIAGLCFFFLCSHARLLVFKLYLPAFIFFARLRCSGAPVRTASSSSVVPMFCSA